MDPHESGQVMQPAHTPGKYAVIADNKCEMLTWYFIFLDSHYRSHVYDQINTQNNLGRFRNDNECEMLA